MNPLSWLSFGAKGAWKTTAGRRPGLPFVVAVLSGAAAFRMGVEEDQLSLPTLLFLYCVAYLFYRLGSIWDPLIFTPLYGTKKDQGALPPLLLRGNKLAWGWARALLQWLPPTRRLDTARELAKRSFGVDHDSGLYGATKQIVGRSKGWDAKVVPLLRVSKAARALILPSGLLALMSVLPSGPTLEWPGASLAAFLAPPPFPPPLFYAACFVASAVLFLYFRVWHMVELYSLAKVGAVVFVDYIPHLTQLNAAESPPRRHRLIASYEGELSDVTDLELFAPTPTDSGDG